MRNEWPDAYHLGIEFFEEQQVVCNILISLVRRTHHESCAGLETDLLEVIKTLLPVLCREICRMQLSVVIKVSRLVS